MANLPRTVKYLFSKPNVLLIYDVIVIFSMDIKSLQSLHINYFRVSIIRPINLFDKILSLFIIITSLTNNKFNKSVIYIFLHYAAH